MSIWEVVIATQSVGRAVVSDTRVKTQALKKYCYVGTVMQV